MRRVRPHRGIRTGRYKLIRLSAIPDFSQPEEWERYDLATDLDENHNLHGRSDQRPGAPTEVDHFPDKPTRDWTSIGHNGCVDGRSRIHIARRTPAGYHIENDN